MIAGLVLLTGVAVASIHWQHPLFTPSFQEAETDEYQFAWPIRRVAIIGAGPSGVVAYRELKDAGLNLRIFERDSVPGDTWHYTEEVPFDAPLPNSPTPIGDFVPSLPPEGIDLPYSEELEDASNMRRDHRGPKQIWESLTTNLPSPLQQFPQWVWPTGTPWEISHYQVRNYVRSYASYLNINSNDENPATAYNTRVERVEKRVNQAGQEQGWRLLLKSLEPTHNNTYRATWWTEDFDAVVVAAGRCSAPWMPSIPGLKEWIGRFPDLVRHSRQYRRPDVYTNKTVLIVGVAVSGTEISRDLNHHAGKIYQSFRAHNYSRIERKFSRIPENTTLIGEINQFSPIPDGSPIQSGLVELKDGTILSGIDSVILATGYRFSFPFLPQYYDGATYRPHADSVTTLSPFLPLDGSHIRDLYLDLFYIRDPTLAFLSVTLDTPSFIFLEYNTLALARVWTNQAKLPNGRTMRTLYAKTIKERGGYGKQAMVLGPGRFSARVAYLIGWLNEAAAKYGGKLVDGFPKYSKEVAHYWQIARPGGPNFNVYESEVKTTLGALGIVPTDDVEQQSYDDTLAFYDDN